MFSLEHLGTTVIDLTDDVEGDAPVDVGGSERQDESVDTTQNIEEDNSVNTGDIKGQGESVHAKEVIENPENSKRLDQDDSILSRGMTVFDTSESVEVEDDDT